MQNDRFRNYFINRFADQMNSVYHPERLVALENAIFEQTVGEMPNQFQRWGDPANVPGQMTDFYNNHLTFQGELVCRGEQVRDHIQENLDLPRQVAVTLSTEPADAGSIRISTLEPATYPWSGVYFDGVPISIDAVAAPGYTFSHWKRNDLISDTLQPVFLDTLQADAVTFSAVFLEKPNGFDNQEPDMGMRLYPSPATTQVQVTNLPQPGAHPLRWSIQDMQGSIRQRGVFAPGEANHTLEISSLPPGLYLVRFDDAAGNSQHGRFVKQ
jgi:hypothetical protein